MALWLVTHTHRFGTSYALIDHPEPPEQALVEAYMTAQFDYEPDREDEWLEIDGISVMPGHLLENYRTKE